MNTWINAWSDEVTRALETAGLEPEQVSDVIVRTLAEDLSWGPDITTEATLPAAAQSSGAVVARAPGCLAGVPIAGAVFETLAAQRAERVEVSLLAKDADRVSPGDAVLSVSGPTRCLLTAERTMLNLLCQLSGVATATRQWSDALEGTGARVRDTRKTVPGLRILQKYAVRCGGGLNHRMGLGDAALIKDNHILAAGSLTAAFEAVRRTAPQKSIEVECDTLDQVREAVHAGAELLLLDNMSPERMTEAVALCRRAGVRTEASGGLSLESARQVAASGVDYISVGALTHSARVLDLGFDLH